MSQNSQKDIYAGVFFSMTFKVAGWKKTPVQVHFCEFYEIFKTDYLVTHVRTAASDILVYPYLRISSVTSTLKKCTVFSSILVFIHFKLILESCATSGVYLEPYQTSMTKLLAVVFWQKYSIITLTGKVLNTVLQPRFLIFFQFLYLDTWMNMQTFCFSSGSAQLLCSPDVNRK